VLIRFAIHVQKRLEFWRKIGAFKPQWKVEQIRWGLQNFASHAIWDVPYFVPFFTPTHPVIVTARPNGISEVVRYF